MLWNWYFIPFNAVKKHRTPTSVKASDVQHACNFAQGKAWIMQGWKSWWAICEKFQSEKFVRLLFSHEEIKERLKLQKSQLSCLVVLVRYSILSKKFLYLALLIPTLTKKSFRIIWLEYSYWNSYRTWKFLLEFL